MERKFALLMIALLFAGCAGPSPGQADLVGVWQGKGAAELDFYPGGELIIKGLPSSVVFGDLGLDGLNIIEGRGRWATGVPGKSGLIENDWPIRMNIAESGRNIGFDAYFVSSKGIGTVFFIPNVDIPDRVEFKRRLSKPIYNLASALKH